jgi:hypothetical protein
VLDKFFQFNETFSSHKSINKEGLKFMRDLFRGLLAGAAAYKLGGGLISTIIIFIVVFWLLGKC